MFRQTSHLATLMLSVAVAGCAAVAPEPTEEEKISNVAKRIDEICALGESERQAAIDKLKAETGLVVACGK